jgi:hypothetical protein
MKTVIFVPVMYSEADMEEFLGKLPSDFPEQSEEYWTYVEQRLLRSLEKIALVCVFWWEETIDWRAKEIVKSLQGRGVKVSIQKDNTLVGEVRAWKAMARQDINFAANELLQESNRELSNEVTQLLSNLDEDGIAVVFLDPACRPSLPEVRVIRMNPFHPEDYLLRYKTKLSLSGRVD